ncbi:hypothetical protein GO730_32585 [Spirosoma sp. HMF3257]|uniref:Uncharacterized protein n=1 Tax=Spirosoma telluris TaxID=2183553 RepID=A0A327NUZ2_9BACT|nr:hypothetical protein [Spirosoma telluris]RAI77684.1 hypothetical protein HMF3257_32485 [Spirosoma telluris]
MKTHSVRIRSLLLYLLLGIGIVQAQAQSDSLRITVSEGTNMAVALSPDGQSLVMDMQGTIWLLPAKGELPAP